MFLVAINYLAGMRLNARGKIEIFEINQFLLIFLTMRRRKKVMKSVGIGGREGANIIYE